MFILPPRFGGYLQVHSSVELPAAGVSGQKRAPSGHRHSEPDAL